MNNKNRINLIDFKLKKSVWNLIFWLYKSKFHWSWINFLEHKEYTFWEPIKNIDWKSSSKTDKIYTKIFEEEKQLDVLFLVDINPSILFSSEKYWKKDLLMEAFYSLAFSAYKNSDNFWVILYDWKKIEKLDYKKDFSNISKTISIIENVKNSWEIEKDRTKNVFEILVKQKINKNLIFVLSDDILGQEDKNLKILWLRNEVIFINIFDFFENNLEKIPSDFSFFSWKKSLNISLNSDKIEKYNFLRKEKIKKFEEILKKNKIWYIYLDTKKDVFKEIMLYFSKI